MGLEERKKIEINSIARLIDELDYFQILKVNQNASPEEIKEAYFRESRQYHPDKFYNEAPDLARKVTTIFKRITEAYKILSDPETRTVYTKSISSADRLKNLRYIHGVQGGMPKEDEGQTPMGRKYFQMGKVAFNNMDYKGARINFQLAAKMEPKNETFKEYMAKVEEKFRTKK